MLIGVIDKVLEVEAETIEESSGRAVGSGLSRELLVIWFILGWKFPFFWTAFVYRLIMLSI